MGFVWSCVWSAAALSGVLLLPGNEPQLGTQGEQKERDWDTQGCNSIFLYSNPSASSVGYGLTLLASGADLAVSPGVLDFMAAVTAGFNWNLEPQVINSDERIIFN